MRWPSGRRGWTLVAALVVADILAVLGNQFLLMAVVLTILTLRVAGRFGWYLGFAIVCLVGLACQIWLLSLTPHTGVSIWIVDLVVWNVVAVAALAGPGASASSGELDRERLRVLFAAGALPALLLLGYVVFYVAHGRSNPGWAMVNDSVGKTIEGWMILKTNGITTDYWFADPAKNALLAIVAASAVTQDAMGSRLFDVVRQSSNLIVVMWAFVAFVAGLIGHQGARGASRRGGAALWVPIVLVQLVTLSWFVAGLAVTGGFINNPPALLVLLLTWIAYCASRQHPLAGTFALIAACITAHYAWAPTIVFPLVALLWTCWRQRAEVFRVPRRLVPHVVLIVAGLIYYEAIFRTMSGKYGSGLALLSLNGSIQPLSVPAVVLLAACLLWFLQATPRTRGLLPSLATATLVAAVVTAFLAENRLKYGQEMWGYYPTKFAWLALSALVVIVISILLVALAESDLKGRLRYPLVVGATVLVAVLMAYTTAPSGTQVHGLGTAKTLYSSQSLRSLFAFQAPFTSIARGNDEDLKLVRTMLNTSGESFAYRLDTDAAPKLRGYMPEEQYVNFWLIPTTGQTAPGAPRPPVQNIFASSTPEDVCIRLSFWHDDPVIWTSDPTAGAAIRRACPAQKFRVKLL